MSGPPFFRGQSKIDQIDHAGLPSSLNDTFCSDWIPLFACYLAFRRKFFRPDIWVQDAFEVDVVDPRRGAEPDMRSGMRQVNFCEGPRGRDSKSCLLAWTDSVCRSCSV